MSASLLAGRPPTRREVFSHLDVIEGNWRPGTRLPHPHSHALESFGKCYRHIGPKYLAQASVVAESMNDLVPGGQMPDLHRPAQRAGCFLGERENRIRFVRADIKDLIPGFRNQ